MFQKPEEIIMAILAVLWVALNYYAAGIATAASLKYTFLISGCVLLWTIVSFWLWRSERILRLYPVLLGLFIGCWTFWLNYFAQGKTAADGSTIWYATGWFKLILVIVPIVASYAWLWRRQHQRKLLGK
ncbi:hypothetical protein [Wielerella bovis]|uniref:hypothetical protein n=1 Tax=Wielerella bovis TaxID=2917790 RepID=UPI002019A0CF|nr:hypothetical protein [Wielerella bovis]MCG7657381.1 hypothetical protein [Wielerella bovis]MCG7659602.1 hypothetical protein [Wielerella bovis]ULJ68557.1 hypothetical protein MIS45_07030 [Wielerella bovis]